jgi:S-adenosylmethionine:tRNA ribosyltransferase-isomerase
VKPDHNINLQEYTYDLPESRIATFPAHKRDESLLLIRKTNGDINRDQFRHLGDYLEEGCHLVFNNSRVIPARLIFTKPTGSRIELFCLTPVNPSGYDQSLLSTGTCEWLCMAGNLKRFTGKSLVMDAVVGDNTFQIYAVKTKQNGNLVQIRFSWPDNRFTFAEVLSAAGKTPLPPYIKREPDENDRERYQTIYSKSNGSVAAPTAGLHFTTHVFEQLRRKHISLHEITLHVGAGTFQPIKTDSVEKHPMHAEFIQVSKQFIGFMAGLNKQVAAVGTTSARTLESLYWLGVKILEHEELPAVDLWLDQWEAYGLPQNVGLTEAFRALDQWLEVHQMTELLTFTRLMIVPGYRFRTINALITNFHQPGSTLLLLVAAFMGTSWKYTYQYALDNGFRFLSYGDSSLLFRG